MLFLSFTLSELTGKNGGFVAKLPLKLNKEGNGSERWGIISLLGTV
jgi:hypothetical protein